MTNGFYAAFKGNAIYSGYNPKNNIDDYETKFKEVATLVIQNKLVSATFQHDGDYIEVSLIKDDLHIDNVSNRFKNI